MFCHFTPASIWSGVNPVSSARSFSLIRPSSTQATAVKAVATDCSGVSSGGGADTGHARATITPGVSGHHHEAPFWAICMPFHSRAIEISRLSNPMATSSGPPSLNGFCMFGFLYSAGA